jgi:hypothetical protein
MDRFEITVTKDERGLRTFSVWKLQQGGQREFKIIETQNFLKFQQAISDMLLEV